MSEGVQNNEVRVALVMDDQATATLNKVAEALANIGKQQHQVEQNEHKAQKQLSLWGMAKATAIGGAMYKVGEFAVEKFAEGFEKLPEVMTEAFHAGVGEIEGQRSIAGVLTMTGVQGSFDQVLDQARLYKESLEDIGVEAGVEDSVLQNVFEGIAARSSKSAVEVEKLTEAVAQAGKAVRGGPAALAQGFEMMEMGMIRARNPIVQLIASSGVLHGNAKSVAKQLQKMAPTEAIKLGEEAIEKMGNKMKAAPPTFSQVVTSLKGLHEQMLEALGVPLVQMLVPYLDQVKHWLIEHKTAIEYYARQFANYIVQQVEDISKWIDELKLLFDDPGFEDGLRSVAQLFKDAFEVGINAGKFFVEAGAGLLKFVGDYKATILMGAQAGTFGDAGRRWAADRTREEAKANLESDLKYGQNPMYSKAGREALGGLAAANNAYAAAGGELTAQDDAIYKSYEARLNAAQQAGEQLKNYADNFNTEGLSTAFLNASKKHEEGTQYYVARLIGGSEELQDKLIKEGGELSTHFSEVVRMLNESGLKEQAEGFAKKIKTAGARATQVTNFNGGQTFNVKQDFRDQDPDRVAVIFRQDILKAAASRAQSRVSMPFGF